MTLKYNESSSTGVCSLNPTRARAAPDGDARLNQTEPEVHLNVPTNGPEFQSSQKKHNCEFISDQLNIC